MGWLLGSRQRMQRAFPLQGIVKKKSQRVWRLGEISSGEKGGYQAQLHKKARADSSVWEIHPCPLYDRLAAGCRLPR